MLLMVLTGIVGVAFGIMCGLTMIDVWDGIATGRQAHNAPSSDAPDGHHVATNHFDGSDQMDGQDDAEALLGAENEGLENGGQ